MSIIFINHKLGRMSLLTPEIQERITAVIIKLRFVLIDLMLLDA